MVNPENGFSLCPEWLEYIKPRSVKDAFCYLIGAAACLRTFQCHAQLKGKRGPVRDFRFIDCSGTQPYSFITNQNSLLFYFRKPSARISDEELLAIQGLLPEASHNPAREITVPITTLAQAKRLWPYLALA